ncbi:MAG: hypothetical protein H3C47_12010 [Candidatus Cloacimonetes bacterium]|nr:hypothetical protein [Candidatus Cloacimonadota bacterium]
MRFLIPFGLILSCCSAPMAMDSENDFWGGLETAPPSVPAPPVVDLPDVGPLPPLEDLTLSSSLDNVYLCLLRELQGTVAHGGSYRYANTPNTPATSVSDDTKESVVGFDVTIDYELQNIRLGRVRYNPLNSCSVEFKSLSSKDRNAVKHELIEFFEAQEFSQGIFAEFREIEKSLNVGESEPRVRVNIAERRVIFKPTKAYTPADQKAAVQKALSYFHKKAGSADVVDADFEKLNRYLESPALQLVRAGNWLVALRMKLTYIGADQADMESPAVRVITDSLRDTVGGTEQADMESPAVRMATDRLIENAEQARKNAEAAERNFLNP